MSSRSEPPLSPPMRAVDLLRQIDPDSALALRHYGFRRVAQRMISLLLARDEVDAVTLIVDRAPVADLQSSAWLRLAVGTAVQQERLSAEDELPLALIASGSFTLRRDDPLVRASRGEPTSSGSPPPPLVAELAFELEAAFAGPGEAASG